MNTDNRRRQNTACLTCRQRKVRCDVIHHNPCSPCRKTGLECQPIPARKKSTRARKTRVISTESTPRTSARQSNAIEIPTPETNRVADTRVENNLSNFFEHGITTSTWAVFAGSEPVRIVYIGTDIANLAHLVKNEQPIRRVNHFPFPQIRSVLPWRPNSESSTSIPVSDEVAQDVSSFPTRSVRDALVEAYFSLVHPGYPVIDEQDFRRQYQDPDNPPPLILFQAVLLAGAHVSDHPLVVESRAMVKATLFRRAKALFDLRYENDRLFLVQAALLMVWHQENSDNVSCNSYYWIGIACRIGFGLGIHRDLSQNAGSLMPLVDRQLYRKVWWTLFQAEAFSALEHGRPCMIRHGDFDQPPLEDNDFMIDGTTLDTNIRADFLHTNVEISHLILESLHLYTPAVLRSNAPTDLTNLNTRLASLAIRMTPSTDFYSCQLRLHYNLVLLHIHRNHHPNTSITEESATIASSAAAEILSTFETLAAHNTLRQAHSTAPMALMAAAIQFFSEIKSALSQGRVLVALSAQARLERLFEPARLVAAFWPSAEAILKLCQRFHEKFAAIIQHAAAGESAMLDVSGDFDAVGEGEGTNGFFWHDILSDYGHAQFGQGDDWMNISAALGV